MATAASPRRRGCRRRWPAPPPRSTGWPWPAAWASRTTPRSPGSSRNGPACRSAPKERRHDAHRLHRRGHHGAAHGQEPGQEGLRGHRVRQQPGGGEGGGRGGHDRGGERGGGGGHRGHRSDHAALVAPRGSGLHRRRRGAGRRAQGHAVRGHVHHRPGGLAAGRQGRAGARGAVHRRAGLGRHAPGHRRHARDHGGRRRRRRRGGPARARRDGRQRDPRGRGGQRRGREALQQPDRGGVRGGGERGLPHRGGLRHGPEGGYRRDLQVLRQHVPDGLHAPGAGAHAQRGLEQRLQARLHDRPHVQGPRAGRRRRPQPPGATLRDAGGPAGLPARLLPRSRPSRLYERLLVPEAVLGPGARLAGGRRFVSRRLKRWLIVVGVLLVLGVAFVWSLPEIVKWQALKQIPAITGRAASIEDIDINLFTGRVAIKKFRLAEADPGQAFVEFERFDVRVVPWSVVFGNVRIAELRLTAPTVNLVRLSTTEFNFSDILRRLAAAKEGAPPSKPVDPNAKSRWTIAVNHFALIRANITAVDRAVSPTSEWKVRDLSIEAGNLTTRPSGPVGTLAVRAALNDSPVEFSAEDIDLTPPSFAVKFSIQNFNLVQIRPYLPPLPATLDSGV